MPISTGWQKQLPGDVLSAVHHWQRRTIWVCEILRLVQAKGPSGTKAESWPLWQSFAKKSFWPCWDQVSPKVIKRQNNYRHAVFLVYWMCIGLFKWETEALCYTRCDWTPACCCMCSSAGSVFHCDSALQAFPTIRFLRSSSRINT